MFYNKVLCDAAEQWQMGLQDPATSIVEGMQSFHNYLVFFSIIIAVFVCFLLFVVIFSFNDKNHPLPDKFTHSSLLEIIWTIIPAFILFLIAIPSFSLLYSLDELIYPTFVVKIIGHQWYWSYEYSDLLGTGFEVRFDSYMVNHDDLPTGAFRLLEVDHRLILPNWVHIRLLVTSADVLHSWAIPSFGIKVDACPGRLSQASLLVKREGLYYGQCSEICGINHGFMPIVVKILDRNTFLDWLVAKIHIQYFT